MRKIRRLLTVGLVIVLAATSIQLPVFAEGMENNFDLNGDGYLDAHCNDNDGVAEYVDVDGDGRSETPVYVTNDSEPTSDDPDPTSDPTPDPTPTATPTPTPTPTPMPLPLVTPNESIELKNYTLTNTGLHRLSYSVNLGDTWSTPTTDNPVDLSSEKNNLAPGGAVMVKYVANEDEDSLDSPTQTISLIQFSPPSGVYAVDPTTTGGQGTIYGVDSSMEYVGTSLAGAPFNAINDTKIDLDPGTYLVRVASSGRRFCSDTVSVTINPFSGHKEPTPNAVFNAVTMVLSNMAENMEYCFDGVTWTHIASGSPTSKTLSDDDARNAMAHGIQVIKKGNGSTTTDSDIQTISINKASTPNCVQGVAPTDNGNSGKIINVDSSMQYKANGAASWIDIGSNVVTNLAPGTYLVRVRASGTTLASDSVSVNIGAYKPTVLPKEHTPGIDFNAQNMMLSDIFGTKYSLDGGNNWTYAKDYNQIQLHDGQVSKDKGIKAFRPGNGTTTSDSDVQTITINKANPPSGVNAVSATSTTQGAITGLQSNMEYGPKGGSWTTVTANAVLLPAGTYYVRTRGAYTTLPSDPIEINILMAATPIPVTPIKPAVIPTAAPTPIPTTQDKNKDQKPKEESVAQKDQTQEQTTEKTKESDAEQATPTPTPIPVVTGPTIAGNTEAAGWDAIKQAATEGPVAVSMNGTTEIPATVLQTIKSAKTELTVEMDHVVWTIPGSAVSDDVTDVNLGVVEDTNRIPQEAVDTVAKNSIATKQFEVEYEGPLGFRATLSMQTDQANAGKFANLFCYQGAGEPMEFIDSSQISEDGKMSFGMVHASSYVIVISDEKYSEETVQGTENVKVKTEKKESRTGWILLIVLIISIVLIAAAVTLVMKKRQEELRKHHRQNSRKK